MQILQQLRGPSGSGRYALNRLDVRTREEQVIDAWGQDDTANTGINMFLEAVDRHHVPTPRGVVHVQFYRMQVWEQ